MSGPICVIVPNFIKIDQTVAEIWRFNGFPKWRPSAILDLWNSKFFTVGAVKRPILQQRTKFRKDQSNRCCDIAIFVILKLCRHLGFWKIRNFNSRSPVEGQSASPCRISSKSVERLLRYGDLTVFQNGGRPPSWICRARIGTTPEVYLVVFIVVLNLVWMAAVLSIIWKF